MSCACLCLVWVQQLFTCVFSVNMPVDLCLYNFVYSYSILFLYISFSSVFLFTFTSTFLLLVSLYLHIYMGSSSVLVLIGSHSLCNSFVVNQFLFFTPNGENSLCYTPKKQWEQYGGKKMFCLFFISKIYSHVTQKWRPKTGMAIPYCLCWKLLDTRRKYSDISNLFAKL